MLFNEIVLGKCLFFVIQSYGYYFENFFFEGLNFVVCGGKSVFFGCVFVCEGVFVLVMFMSLFGYVGKDLIEQLCLFNEGVRGVVDIFVKEGCVDFVWVGIIGWSMMGEKVLNLVMFFDFFVCVVIIVDGDVNIVFLYMLIYGCLDFIWVYKEVLNYGMLGLVIQVCWVDVDFLLNIVCVKIVFCIEIYGRLVKNNWDIYVFLWCQYKFVEMVVIFGGVYVFLMLSECMVFLQGNIDWFNFWLKGEQWGMFVLVNEIDMFLKYQYEVWQ